MACWEREFARGVVRPRDAVSALLHRLWQLPLPEVERPTAEGTAHPQDKEPLDPFAADLTISYSYCMDARGSLVTAWTEQAPTTVRLAADKKAGTRIGSPGNPMKLANHGGDGRNVLYHDGHVSFKAGPAALDPDEASSSDEEGDMIGEPGAGNHRRWWSDPPYRGE